ncbi:unnamed protein product, partial [Mesorhabditis belari]|uniref:Uncharacterized protein n=1 Tax=Mesorhabditis belari TaxID=2138241 RepID=A0AAF3EEC5_9BILA
MLLIVFFLITSTTCQPYTFQQNQPIKASFQSALFQDCARGCVALSTSQTNCKGFNFTEPAQSFGEYGTKISCFYPTSGPYDFVLRNSDVRCPNPGAANFSSNITQPKTCQAGWQLFNGECYSVQPYSTKLCANFGATVPQIGSLAENIFIADMLNTGCEMVGTWNKQTALIGGTANNKAQVFVGNTQQIAPFSALQRAASATRNQLVMHSSTCTGDNALGWWYPTNKGVDGLPSMICKMN